MVERVEIVEDTETESESVDTDPEEKNNSTVTFINNKQQKKEMVSILKRGGRPSATETDQKDLSDLLDEALEQSSCFLQKSRLPMSVVTSTPTEITKSRVDTEIVAEYMILDDAENTNNESNMDLVKCKGPIGFVRRIEDKVGTSSSSPLPKRTKIQQLVAGEFVKEDCDSFYGSDKETDDVLIFSDDTEIDVGSSSSEESEQQQFGGCKRDVETKKQTSFSNKV